MLIDNDCKAVIESMNDVALNAYIFFLEVEIRRHRRQVLDKLKKNSILRHYNREDTSAYNNVFRRVLIRLNQTAIWRHRKDIKSSRLCVENARARLEMLSI